MEITRELVEEQGGKVINYDNMVNTIAEEELRFDQDMYEWVINELTQVMSDAIDRPRKFKQCSTLFMAIYSMLIEWYDEIKWDRAPSFTPVSFEVVIEDLDHSEERFEKSLKEVLQYLNKIIKEIGKEEKSHHNLVKVHTIQHIAYNLIQKSVLSSGSLEPVINATKWLSHITIDNA